MNKFVLWLYVIETMIIIKGVFRGGLVDGFPIILIGVGCIVAGYYIGKHIKRFLIEPSRHSSILVLIPAVPQAGATHIVLKMKTPHRLLCAA